MASSLVTTVAENKLGLCPIPSELPLRLARGPAPATGQVHSPRRMCGARAPARLRLRRLPGARFQVLQTT
jgi:hypothetical protein